VQEVPIAAGHRPWAELLAAALIERQRFDGSWANAAVDVREDDPLVATSLAVISLSTCSDSLRARQEASR
jgi:hypothetical protein